LTPRKELPVTFDPFDLGLKTRYGDCGEKKNFSLSVIETFQRRQALLGHLCDYQLPKRHPAPCSSSV
jgi:hypothetical protein